jgi:hypothetical protein
MKYRKMLRWCAGADGRLRRDRLERVAQARGYEVGWIRHLVGRHWERAWTDLQEWRERRLAEDEQ